jgi:hypothetical protein
MDPATGNGRGYCHDGKESSQETRALRSNVLTHPLARQDIPFAWAKAVSAPHQQGGRIVWLVAHCTHQESTIYILMLLTSSLLLSPQGVVWVYPLLRASTEHIQIVRGLRAEGIDQTAPHVSIISNRASNSCPQAVQRIQSDSTVNSSDLIPMPPQSGQRARWTF